MATTSQRTTISDGGDGGEEGSHEEQPPEMAGGAGQQLVMPEDGYEWKKYGQKYIKNIQKVRSYFKCRDKRCNAKKKVEWHPLDPSNNMRIVYEGTHHHGSQSGSNQGTSDSVANPYELGAQVFGPRSH